MTKLNNIYIDNLSNNDLYHSQYTNHFSHTFTLSETTFSNQIYTTDINTQPLDSFFNTLLQMKHLNIFHGQL